MREEVCRGYLFLVLFSKKIRVKQRILDNVAKNMSVV